MNPLTDPSSTVLPGVKIGMIGRPLIPSEREKLERVVVDQHLFLPNMFELTFMEDGKVLSGAGIDVGTKIVVNGVGADEMSGDDLIEGEVTSIEGDFAYGQWRGIARGYEKVHKLQRASKSRSWENKSDGDLARQIATDNGLSTDTIDSGVSHKYIAQVDQTDFEFLLERARENAYEFGVSNGKLYFRKPSSATGGGLAGMASSAASALGVGGPKKLRYLDNLVWFRPRVSGASLTSKVEVRVWDPLNAKVVVGKEDVAGGNAKLKSAQNAKKLANAAGGLGLPSIPSLPVSIPGLPDLGPLPDSGAHTMNQRPLGSGTGVTTAANAAAKGFAEHLGSSFAEAEGWARGSPKIKPGEKVTIEGLPSQFNGDWIVTQARHVFDVAEQGGYYTHFVISGRNDRTLLGLTSLGMTQERDRRIAGFVAGICTNNNDPEKLGRVKVTFPWLAPDFVTDWAKTVQLGAGKTWGHYHVPEVGDELLVGFEFGDIRRPYVVGGLINKQMKPDIGGEPVKVTGPKAEVVKRGYASRLGHRIVFDDDQMGQKSGIQIGTKDLKLSIQIDDVNKVVKIVSDATGPPAKIEISQNGNGGAISVTQKGQGGKIEVKADGDVSMESGPSGSLTLKGGSKGVTVESQGQLSLKGSAGATLDGGATTTIKGGSIKVG